MSSGRLSRSDRGERSPPRRQKEAESNSIAKALEDMDDGAGNRGARGAGEVLLVSSLLFASTSWPRSTMDGR